jgi:hypothetical protein
MGGKEGIMADWSSVIPMQERRAVRNCIAADPFTEAERLVASIKHAVWRETGAGVHDLRVQVTPNGVLISGHCHTYYAKQKAQHAAMEVSGGRLLTNLIDVM